MSDKVDELGEAGINEWASQWTLDRCLRLGWRAPGVEQAIEARDRASRTAHEAVEREQWEARVRAAKEDGAKTIAVDYDQVLDETIERLERVESERDEYQAQAEQLRSENRRLKWELQQAWDPFDAPVDDYVNTLALPRLLLSESAQDICAGLDKGVMHEVEVKILNKLTQPTLIDNYAEILPSSDGQCVAYPRDRGADRMRVILQRSGEDLYILELFTDHEDYDTFRDRLGQRPLDVSRYQKHSFVHWTNDVPRDTEE